MPKISCVIATRDRDNTIAEAIQSIIDQSEPDWELIVVDDHSREGDETEAIAKSFNDERISYHKLTDENGIGISSARNFGNILAKSGYIAVMDSDDISYKTRFERTLKEFKETNADIIYGDYDRWYEKEDKIERYTSRVFNLDDFKRFDFIPHVTSCYKRSLAIDFPYNSFYRRAEDYDFFARAFKYNFAFSYINEPLVKVRMHEGSIITETGLKFDYSNEVRLNSLKTNVK